jgi:hypothetical protein
MLTGFAHVCSAGFITHMDRTLWESAVVVDQTVTFSAITPPTAVQRATPYTEGNTTVAGYTGNNAFNLWVRNPLKDSVWDYGSGALVHTINNANTPRLEILFATPVLGVGFSVMTNEAPGALVQIILNNTQTYTVQTTPRPTAVFWGVTGDTPITSVRIRPQGAGQALLDTISSAKTLAPTPEPEPEIPAAADAPEASSLLLGAGGLIAIGLWRRKQVTEN